MQLIREFNIFNGGLISAEEGIRILAEDLSLSDEQIDREISRKPTFLKGLLQKADAENGNGRIYPYNILKREADNYETLVKERRAIGEMDHSDSPIVELKNACHIITKLWWEGKELHGIVEILKNSRGRDLESLVESNVKLGISSRGLGSTRQEGGKTYVESDFQLICWDFVSDPSTFGAFMSLNEGREISNEEFRKVQSMFGKNYRINAAINDILER